MKKLCMILPLAMILCFMVGCQDKEAMAELEEFRAQKEIEEQNKELVRHLFEELNKGNPEIQKELLATDYVYYFPSNTPKPLSREEYIENTKMGFTVFPDVNFSIKELFADGDIVILWYIWTGTHEGEQLGIPPTGKKVEVSSISIMRIQNGKIVEEREGYNALGVMQQLGMELRPKEGK